MNTKPKCDEGSQEPFTLRSLVQQFEPRCVILRFRMDSRFFFFDFPTCPEGLFLSLVFGDLEKRGQSQC